MPKQSAYPGVRTHITPVRPWNGIIAIPLFRSVKSSALNEHSSNEKDIFLIKTYKTNVLGTGVELEYVDSDENLTWKRNAL